MVDVSRPDLHKGQPFAALVEKKTGTGGRNNAGRITTRHRGGGHAQKYRVIDFKDAKMELMRSLNVWNTILTVLHISLLSVIQMVNGAIL